MGRRITATVVLVAGIAALLWVMLGADTGNEVAVSTTTPTATPATSESELNSTEATTSPIDEAAQAGEVAPTAEPAIETPENLGPRMDLVDIDGWRNTSATSIDDFNGKVLLVEMWTFGCSNCKARIPFNQSYYEEFKDENFEIVGVHAPEFSYEADVANIEQALVDLGVTWPVALDTSKKNFRSWQPGSTNFWPRTFVIDQNGDIRYDHIGEGKYEELRETLRFLIDNPPPTPAT